MVDLAHEGAEKWDVALQVQPQQVVMDQPEGHLAGELSGRGGELGRALGRGVIQALFGVQHGAKEGVLSRALTEVFRKTPECQERNRRR